MSLLAAGHFIEPAATFSTEVVTITTTTSPIIAGWNVGYAAAGITIIVTLASLLILVYRFRKGCDSKTVAVGTQTDNQLNPELIFTPHGQCYHVRGCDTVENWRRGATQLVRRPCCYCLSGVMVEPDPERG